MTDTALPSRLALWAGTLLLALAYLIPGLTGHDPWKQDEAYSFGIIYNMATTGDLVVPTLAADPFMEKPPAYYITAAGLVRLLHGYLPAHDAARLASGLYLALAFLFTGLMARATWGEGRGLIGVIALIATVGLIVSGHFMITDTALTAGMAMACYGLLRTRIDHWGGFWLGTGAGLAFMSKGLLVPGILGISVVLLALFRDWRSWTYVKALLVAALAALPWLLIWPTALYLRSPELFHLWFWDNNFGRYLGFSELGPPTVHLFWLQTVPWVTFPVLPLALWSLWSKRQTAFGNPGVRMALVVSVVGWGVLFGSSTARELYTLPLLPLLAVLAAGALERLPRPVVTFSYWFSAGLFGLLSLIIWAFWVYNIVAGRPPQWSWLGEFLTLDYAGTWDRLVFAIAATFQIAWAWCLWRWRPPRTGALLAWPVGLTLIWGLLAVLHLPWIEQARSYRGVFTELRAQLPDHFNCVADLNLMPLRECERGMLFYVADMTTEHVDSPAQTSCDYIVTETNLRRRGAEIEIGAGWERIWRGSLPPVRLDLFTLFRRVPAPAAGETPPAP
ncbi:glycosyltransferase family 39 protein [uncultured Thiodictyon sp.]|uniref:ArnT family glycosyltransferase n=3 Tax=uncultured Thiodictyon sp. TaxID=1846217 RepID=UPI0025EC4036|nr:glycosyltransferase family 39 protein [uncultured Thiodictyon sp.]